MPLDSLPTDDRNVRRAVWSFATLLIALSALFEFASYTGLIASDDLGYSHYAGQIAAGTYRLVHHHYAIRYGLLLPVAAVYRLFGVHEWTTVIIPLAASILTPFLLAVLCVEITERRVAAIAGLLMATFAVAIRYGSILVPEPVLLAALLAAAIAFVHAQKSRSAGWALVAGILFGLAYLTKEPGAAGIRGSGERVCDFTGKERRIWRAAFTILASDELGCTTSPSGEIAPDPTGEPVLRLLSRSCGKQRLKLRAGRFRRIDRAVTPRGYKQSFVDRGYSTYVRVGDNKLRFFSAFRLIQLSRTALFS
ncbi:MAG TPA: glycosyltransferase family 39 protein [Bryobacteraceae bacterium]|jgi:hypothetical protein|nr:glycosyltransferase family 39 protein [Bryobacteraceae bacterium]